MKDEDKKKFLNSKLRELEESVQKIVNSRSYSRDVAKVRLLEEMIKEQLQDENSRYAASTPR